jgi:hypothetical protein
MYLWHDRVRNSGGGGGCSQAMIRATQTTRKTTSTGKMCRKPSMQMLVDCSQGNIKCAGGSTNTSLVHFSME